MADAGIVTDVLSTELDDPANKAGYPEMDPRKTSLIVFMMPSEESHMPTTLLTDEAVPMLFSEAETVIVDPAVTVVGETDWDPAVIIRSGRGWV